MSTSSFFKFHRVIRRLQEGPLGVHIDAYAALLQEQGYKRASACVHLQIVADLSRWMQRRNLVSRISMLRHSSGIFIVAGTM
jgi:hypothetical protein